MIGSAGAGTASWAAGCDSAARKVEKKRRRAAAHKLKLNFIFNSCRYCKEGIDRCEATPITELCDPARTIWWSGDAPDRRVSRRNPTGSMTVRLRRRRSLLLIGTRRQ